DAAVYDPALPAADRVLADVPCSGLGILNKKPDIRYKTLDGGRRRELLATQSAILDCAARYLKPGGGWSIPPAPSTPKRTRSRSGLSWSGSPASGWSGRRPPCPPAWRRGLTACCRCRGGRGWTDFLSA